MAESGRTVEAMCGGPGTGCEEDGEMEPAFGEMVCVGKWIDHGPTCPTRQSAERRTFQTPVPCICPDPCDAHPENTEVR